METKANHLAVGAFVLVVIAGLFGFVVWLGRGQIDQEAADRYEIFFDGTVSGLSVASKVLYRGVRVGSVAEIEIDPENSERIRVMIDVTPGTPIKLDSVATLELQGVTGLVNIQIAGGSQASPRLRPAEGRRFAVIPSAPSRIETLFRDIPTLINKLTRLADRGNLLLSDDNLGAIGVTLQNVTLLSESLAGSAEEIGRMTTTVAAIAGDVQKSAQAAGDLVAMIEAQIPPLVGETQDALKAARNAAETLDSTTGTLGEEARASLADLRKSVAAVTATANGITKMVDENRAGLRDFSSQGLYELSRFLVEARVLVASLNRISERFEADPARFLFGDAQEGFKPK